jgi:hypothetical protein
MTHARVSRPNLVWVISIVLGVMAASQVIILSLLLLLGSSRQALGGALAPLSALDWVSLYLLAGILLTSMVLFFRMRKISILWFVAYIGLGSCAALLLALTPAREPYFNELASLAGLSVALTVLGYMLQLKKQRRLA